MKVRFVTFIFVTLVLWLVGCRQVQPIATSTVRPTDTPAPVVALTLSPTEPPVPTATFTPSPTTPPEPSGWIRLESGAASRLTAVDCLDNDICLVVGEDGTILKTTNGGIDWVALAPESRGGLILADIDCPDKDTCYAVSLGTFSSQQENETPTGDGAVIKTSDGGESWSAVGSSQFPLPGDISCSTRDTCYVEGDFGTIFKTVDGGESWSTPISETELDHSHLHCLDEDNCVSIGPEGAIYITDDGGSTWVARGAGADIDTIRALACPIDSSTCYALSFEAITKTTDGGASWSVWQKHGGDETSQLRALDCPDNDTCYAVSSSGVVYKTADGGETWRGQFRNPELSGGLQDIACPVSSDICYAVGDRGTILKTTDGGASPPRQVGSNWIQVQSPQYSTSNAC